MLPTMRGERRVLGEVTAEPHAAMWRGIPAHEFRLAMDGRPPQQGTTVRSVWDAAEWRVLLHESAFQA